MFFLLLIGSLVLHFLLIIAQQAFASPHSLRVLAAFPVDGQHAVSIGKIDEEKMFYLMSRGLDLKESRRLIVEAAFNPVLDKIASEELRDEIDSYIKGRLGKNE